MTKEMIEELVELEIFNEQDVSKEEYEKGMQGKSDSVIYMKYQGFTKEWQYKKINTNNLNDNELSTYLQIQQLKMIKSIKAMIAFFVVLTVIGMVLTFISILNML